MTGERRGWLVRRAGLARTATAAFVLGLALAALMPIGAVWAVCTQVFALLAAACTLALQGSGRRIGPAARSAVPWMAVGLLLASGILVGSIRIDGITASDLEARAGERFEGTAVVIGQASSDGRRWSAPAEVGSALVGGRPFPEASGEKVLLEARRAGDLGIAEGTVLSVRGHIELPESSPSGFDRRAYLRRRGIAAVISAGSGPVDPIGRRGGIAGLLDSLRVGARRHLGLGVDAVHGGLLRGVVLGDKSGVPEPIMEAFRLSGTAHMLAVSGLHVGSLAAIGLGAGRALRIGPKAGSVAAALLVLVFVPLTGAGPSVVRAATMILVMLAGQVVGRSRERWQGLLLAAGVVLGRNPLDLYSPGFQLSFAAVTGLFLLVPVLEAKLAALPAAVRSGLAVSVAATVGTAPVALIAFGRAAWVGVIANLLVVPVLPFVMGLGLASLAGGYVWDGLAAAFNMPAAALLEWAVRISSLCAQAPPIEPEDVGRVAFGAAGAGAAVWRLRRSPGSGVPAGLRLGRHAGTRADPRTKQAFRAGTVIIATGGAMLLYPACRTAADSVVFRVARGGWPEHQELRILDVGQGNAAVLRAPSGRTVLVDAGPDGEGLETELRRLGVRFLDLVVISHPHADHYGGLREVMGRIPVGVLVDNVARSPDGAAAPDDEVGAYVGLRRNLVEEGARHLNVTSQGRLRLEGVDATFRAPAGMVAPDFQPAGGGVASGAPRGPPAGSAPTRAAGSNAPAFSGPLNDASIVVSVQVGTVRVLLPGDAEAHVLSGYELQPADVVVAPHHGSAGGLDERLLERLRPRGVVISVGEGNHFDHPHAETLDLLSDWGVPVLRTDLSGWIRVGADASGTGSGVVLWTEDEPQGDRR